MMDPAIKVALALCVLLSGVCAAMLFRNDKPRPVLPSPNVEEPAPVSCRMLAHSRGNRDSPDFRDQADRPQTGRMGENGTVPSTMPNAPTSQPPVVVTATSRRERPPVAAPDYPQMERTAGVQSRTAMKMMLPVTMPADSGPRTHRIVDGDTLAALADRYLGSADRAGEIFAANRDVLQNPSLLPIGAELKIPPR
jgi:nucleoid-associated protein YgaU